MADASLSTYPTSVDTFNRISDLDENTLKKSNQYKKLVNAGNYAGAKAYLNDEGNTDLKQCAINAEIVNKHSDAIVAIENDINENVKSDINDINTRISRLKNPWVMLTLTDSLDASNNYVLNCSEKILHGGTSGGFTVQNSYITCPCKGKIVLTLNALMDCTTSSDIQCNGYTGIFIYNYTKTKYCNYSVGGLGNIPRSVDSINRSAYVSAKSCPFEVDAGDIIIIVLKNPSAKVKIKPFDGLTLSGIPYGSGNTLTLEYIDFEYN